MADSAFTLPTVDVEKDASPEEHKPEALDFSHHLSRLSRERMESPLKSMYKYMGVPGMAMLAGGLPHPDYFPFDTLSASVLSPTTYVPRATSENILSIFWRLLGFAPETSKIEVPKYAKDPTDSSSIQLATALQYGMATGLPMLQAFIKEFTAKVYKPAYSNWDALVNCGSTDAWSKIVQLLCERGDGILVEAFTYPSAIASAWPLGVRPVSVGEGDAEGMTAEGLEKVLSQWNEEERGGTKRPTILYTVPVGQNPTGTTMGAERKKAIYAICVKYDVIIVEDDPYYFLQAGEYSASKLARTFAGTEEETDSDFIASLAPSYLRFDYQGRVIRIDTFSKTIAPGSRLGWTTCNPLFSERLQRAGETSTQAPSGFAQAMITQLLANEWKFQGFLTWLKGIKAQYRTRRDWLIDALVAQDRHAIDVTRDAMSGAYEARVPASRDAYGYMKEKEGGKIMFSFVPPSAGMFVWVKVHLVNHPRIGRVSANDLTMELWEKLAKNKVLVAPSGMFDAKTYEPALIGHPPAAPGEGPNPAGHFRMAFSQADQGTFERSAKTFATVVRKFFEA